MISACDSSLMMIEPKGVAKPSAKDEAYQTAVLVWANCKASAVSYRGFHVCACGATSDNRDWETPTGRRTNSLLVHYVEFHRPEIPKDEWQKLLQEWAACPSGGMNK